MIIFDFDDTLCIHTKHGNFNPDDEYNASVIIKEPNEIWNKPEKQTNIHMEKLMSLAKVNSVKMGLMSATLSFLHMRQKQLWVWQNYGVMLENYCVGKREAKLEMLRAISTAYEIRREQILFIDDCYETVTEAYEAGFDACSPMEVVNYIESLNM
jgi:hypothetical protein